MLDIIVNPVSGHGAGAETLSIIENHLKIKNIKYRIHHLHAAGEAKKLTARICSEDGTVIVAIGGDGTFHEVINGMDFEKARIGFVPAGRGNDFAEGAGLTFDPIKAIESVIQGIPAERDYIRVGDRRCLNVAGTGLDIEVLKMTENSKNRISYIRSLFRCLISYKPYMVSVKVNGKTSEHRCVMAAICNGNQFGGGIHLCPPAKSDDGLLDLMLVKQPALPTFCVMPEFINGRHMKKKYVEHIVCESAVITNLSGSCVELDGEIYDDGIIEASVVKGGLKTFAQM